MGLRSTELSLSLFSFLDEHTKVRKRHLRVNNSIAIAEVKEQNLKGKKTSQ
jgi:hypothetical protein